MTNPHVERVRTALLPLCEPIHDAFVWADQLRRERLPELAGADVYRWHTTHTVRALAHHRLSQLTDLIAPWTLVGAHRQNGALWLTDGCYRTRVLHTPEPNDVPPPGSNRARRAYYRNLPLVSQPPLFGEPEDRLLLLWHINPRHADVAFRVVRPIGTWRWGEHQLTDLDFVLPTTADDLAMLYFEPSEEDLGVDLPAEEEGDSADGITG